MTSIDDKLEEIIRQISVTNAILSQMEKRLPAKPRFEREVEAVKKLSNIRKAIYEMYEEPVTAKEVMDSVLSML